MADDDEVDAEEFAEVDEGPDEVEPDELDDDGEDEFGIEDDFEEAESTDADEDEDEADDSAERSGPTRRSVPTEDEDEDEDLLAPDDVEADLDTILKDRMVAADDEGDEDDDEPEERGEQADRLQPKRADEQLCPSCFLLVRHSAPVCPVGDDQCPLFS